MRKVFLIFVPILLVSCSSYPPDIYLSCSGYMNTLSVYNGQISNKQEPKIVSFTAKVYPPIEKNKNPYDVRIEHDTYDSSIVQITDDFIMGKMKINSMRENKEDEYSFHLNRKTGVLQFTEKQFFGKTGQITNSFEGNCTKLKNKI